MDIILYSTNCPRCNVLNKKLIQKGITFKLETEFDPQFLKDMGFDSAPVLKVGDEFKDYKAAVDWVNKKN